MLGGFVLAALCLSLVVAWPGRRRWPWWLIIGLTLSVTVTLSFASTLGASSVLWIPSSAVSLGFIALAGLRDLSQNT
jgi:hypothetical protein